MISIQEVNQLDYEEFIAKFGNTVEHCGLCAAAVWRYRPFASVEDIINKIAEFLEQLSIPGKEGVLRLHPDLAGRLALSGGLTEESRREQSAAGLGTMTDEERRRMSDLNSKYRTKFGFPFVICARENKKMAILHGLETRLQNDAATEAVTGVNEVKKICALRLRDLVDPKSLTQL